MNDFVSPKYTVDELLAHDVRIMGVSERLFGSSGTLKPKTFQGHQFYFYGITRRLLVINESFIYLTKTFLPDREKVLTDEEITGALLHLNSIYFHMWGCIDNLAWVIAYETGYLANDVRPSDVEKNKISLFKKTSRNCKIIKLFYKLFPCPKKGNLREHISSISSDFYNDGNKYKRWIEKLGKRRHPVAHGIPIYMVPYFLTTREQVVKWENMVDESTRQLMEGVENENEEKLREAVATMDSLGHNGGFFPNITHELKFNKDGGVSRDSIDPLYPTIIDDCEQLLLLVEKCTTFLSTSALWRGSVKLGL